MLGDVCPKPRKKAVRSDSKGVKMAGTTGLEPATSDVTGRRSNQTELRPRLRAKSATFRIT